MAHKPRDAQVDRRSSSGLRCQLHLSVELGNRLEHDLDLGSDSTAWLPKQCQNRLPHIISLAGGHLLSAVRGCGQPLDSCPMARLE